MLVAEETIPSDFSGPWRRGLWVSLIVLLLAVLSLAPYLVSSTELVRMRNALLMTEGANAEFSWTPNDVPADYLLERGPVDPFFSEIAGRLQLQSLPDDWARALAISRHLLGGSPTLHGGAVMDDLRNTYKRIVVDGDGYCGDFVDVFSAIAIAGGMSVRTWAFSFDGFGGHGHIWPEIWNAQLGKWQLLDVFNNTYFPGPNGDALSAIELRNRLLQSNLQIQREPLLSSRRFGMPVDHKAWDYYRRGVTEWYMWWGNNVFTYDSALLVRAFAGISRSLEQLGAMAQGVHPSIRVLADPHNQLQRARMSRLRIHLIVSGLVGAVATLFASVCGVVLTRRHRKAYRSAFARLSGSNVISQGSGPQIIVLTNLFPHSGTPGAGPFIRERMFRVGKSLPLAVVVPVPWFPFQGVVRRFRPHFRPPAPHFQFLEGFPVFLPRFFSVPGIFRCLDGTSMALSCFSVMRQLKRINPSSIIDAHFAYPAGYAGVLLGRWLSLPSTITMRGTEVSLAVDPCRRARMTTALRGATRVFAVAESLRQHAGVLGADVARVKVIGNGVDLNRFFAEPRSEARARYGIPDGAPVLVSVGGLVERKGFHRVIALLPKLLAKHPGLRYLVIGGSSPEGDMSSQLREQVAKLGLGDVVQFLGALPPDEVRWPLSAADVFVLATSNEGWANVFLEAMACGLPVVTTDVGGNSEVVCRPEIGTVVPFGNEQALFEAMDSALARVWCKTEIVGYARANTWDNRVALLMNEFRAIAEKHSDHASQIVAAGHPDV